MEVTGAVFVHNQIVQIASKRGIQRITIQHRARITRDLAVVVDKTIGFDSGVIQPNAMGGVIPTHGGIRPVGKGDCSQLYISWRVKVPCKVTLHGCTTEKALMSLYVDAMAAFHKSQEPIFDGIQRIIRSTQKCADCATVPAGR